MRTRGPALVRRILAALSISATIAACLGDDPDTSASSSPPSSPVDAGNQSAETGPPPDGDGSDAAATDDAAPPCAPNETRCGAVCADLMSSSDHCYRCDRSCGGAKCEYGKCGVDTVATDLTGLNDLALDDTHIYFTMGNFVRRCPKAGPCAGAAVETLADFTGLNDDGTGLITVTQGRVIFVGATNGSTIRLYNCPVTGCPGLSSFASSRGGFDAIAIAGEQVYFHSPQSGVESSTCSATGDCSPATVRADRSFATSPLVATADHYYFAKKEATAKVGIARCPASEVQCTTVVDVANVPKVEKLLLWNDELVIHWPGGQGGGSAIERCKLPNCGSRTRIRSSTTTYADVTVEGDDVFWIEEGQLRTCPITSCAMPDILASGLTSPRALQADKQFVYWIEGASAAIKRVAR